VKVFLRTTRAHRQSCIGDTPSWVDSGCVRIIVVFDPCVMLLVPAAPTCCRPNGRHVKLPSESCPLRSGRP
jgi:hypothetical protein